MKRSKKFLAFITALSISATAFAGLATTAFAENDISDSEALQLSTFEEGTAVAEPEAEQTVRSGIDPESIYYQVDFEDTSKTYINSAEGTTNTPELWASQNYFGGLSIATDSNPAINKNMTYLNNQGRGTRTAYYILPTEAGTLKDNQAVVEFDFNLKNSYIGGNNQIVLIGNSSTPIGNNDYEPGNNPKGTAAILKFTQPMTGEGQFIINNTGATLEDATAKSSGYVNGTWAHAKAVMNFESKSVLVTVTSLDGSETYVATTQVPMDADATKLSQLFVAAARKSDSVSLDNVVVREVGEGDVTGTYYNVTFMVDGKQSVVGVKEGETLKLLPDTSKTGYIFKGWNKNDDTSVVISSEDVLAAPITDNVKYTAVYEKDSEYIEPLQSLEFSKYPEGNEAVSGADANTPADNLIKVKLIGEIGTDLVANPDDRVTDLNVEWKFDGFRHIVSKAQSGENAATSDDPSSNSYCDSYAELVEVDDTSVNFKLKSAPFNYYGRVTATVTYNGKTMSITKPLAVVPTKNVTAGQILPKPGYVENFDWYSDDMVGYQATTSSDNKGATDVVTGDWAAYGGNSGRGLYIESDEEGNKFLKLKSTGNNSSSFAANNIEAPTGQVIISQDVRFYSGNSSILYKSENPVTWNDNATSVSLDFDGSGFSINGSEVFAEGTTGEWYRIVIAADVTSKLCYASVYNADGSQLIGKSDVVPFSNAGSVTPKYLCYRTPDSSQGELDFNNVKVYTPTIDEGTFKTTIENETIAIPELPESPVATTNLTVSAQSTEGYEMVGAATWSVVDEPTGVTIKADEANSHSAVLSVANGAPAGEIKVRVSLGGVTKDITVNLTSSQDSVKFTQKTSSISIPLTAGNDGTYVYEAKVVDKDGTPVEGKDVTYALYDKNNVNEVTSENMPAGISFDKETATLTVTYEAKSTILYIRAMGTNSNGEPISRAERINIHGLAFDFGNADTESTAEGYTAIAPDTAYSDSTGYGISNGTATVGGEGTIEDADSDSLTGTFTFKANVEPAKVYNVTINYNGNIASEYVNADLSGVQLSNAEKGAVTYTIPVIDDVLDLSFANANVSSIVIEKQPDKTPGVKPSVYVTGDSTTANNGSWAYNLARDYGTKYTELADIASFYNTGRGGKNLSTYYTGGELRDRVLSQIRPGDYVIIGSQGTNGMGSSFEEDVNYYIDACEALGAKIIISSYSPHGCVAEYANGYDSSTQTFNSYRKDSYDEIYRKVYEERTDFDGEKYDANIIGFIDIGKNADAAFNAYVDDFAANGYDSRDAAAQAIIKCFSDHNHYSVDPLAATLMIEGYDGVPGIVSELVRILNIKSCVKIVAEYDDEGVLINVTSTPTLETNATAAVKEGNTLTTYWYSFESMEPVVK